jgi:hypothetical protein
MKILVALVIIGGAVVCAAMFVDAWREPNPGLFWDGDNPSGFHRFVPPVYGLMVYAAVVWAVVWFANLQAS